MNYVVVMYNWNQWGIFHKPTKNWCVFGKKKALIKRVALLNKEDKQ